MGTVMPHDCYTCFHMHRELMPSGCAAAEYIEMTEPEQLAFWLEARVPCQFWRCGND